MRIENPQRKQELEPWRVILSFLPELKSDQILSIIGRTGLPINWTTTKEESYSNATRTRAYMPRIIEAYSKLSADEKLRVAWIVTKEIASLGQDHYQKLNDALRVIGWKIESNKLNPDDVEVKELFFPRGAMHDAYVELKKIINLANKEVVIVDPYLDGSIFQMIKTSDIVELEVRFLSAKLPSDFALEAKKFTSQHSSITLEIRKTKEFHDRFIVIDNNQCFHVGASIKDAGGKAFMISPIEDKENSDSLILQLKQSWERAAPFPF